MEDKEILVKICDAAQDKKADNVVVLDISQISSVADYFVITNGNNVNQVQAIADNVEEAMSLAGYTMLDIEGYNSAGWILMDYGNIVIHVFNKDDRMFYDLERIWGDGKKVEL